MHPSATKTLCDPERLPPELQAPVLALGNFDGVHLGHKALLAQAKAIAHRLHRPAGLLTFEPHPRAVMRPDVPLFRLTSAYDRALILARLGIDLVIIETFNDAFRSLTPEAFETAFLHERFAVSALVVGPNFRYGSARAGDIARLRNAGQHHGFEVHVAEAFLDADGAPVSSSSIRDRLTSGDVAETARRLGHYWFLHAKVEHGDKRGRLLGFPTANLHLPRSCALAWGIYAVRVNLADRMVDGVASFGSRPTFDDGPPKLEVFLFDFTGDLYGKEIGVEFIARLRGESKFTSIEALRQQMERDCLDARAAISIARCDEIPSMLG